MILNIRTKTDKPKFKADKERKVSVTLRSSSSNLGQNPTDIGAELTKTVNHQEYLGHDSQTKDKI